MSDREQEYRLLVLAGVVLTVAFVCATVVGVVRARMKPKPCPDVNATMTIRTDSEVLYLRDASGVEIGFIPLGDEITVTIRRQK